MARNIEAAVKTEAQKDENEPVYLVEIGLDGNTKYYTDNNESVNFPASGGHTYEARGLSFSEIKTSISGEYDRVKVQLDNTDRAMSILLAAYTFQGKTLTINRVFQGLLASADNYVVVFSGVMGKPLFKGGTFEITVYSWRYKLQHLGPGRLYEVNCPHTFDSADCLGGKVYTADTISFIDLGGGSYSIHDSASGYTDAGFTLGMTFTVSGSTSNDGAYLALSMNSGNIVLASGTLTPEAAGATITITASLARETTGTLTAGSDANDLYDTGRTEADGYWVPGIIEMTSGAADGQKRPVTEFENTGGHIGLHHPLSETPSPGDTYIIRRGCPKTGKACKYTYNNYVNFGGFPNMPRDSILE